MDSHKPSPPVAGIYDLGFATLSVFVDSEGAVVASGFSGLDELAAGRPYIEGTLPEHVTDALDAWKAGHFAPLMDVPVRITGTPRIIQMRSALRSVPAGEVITYTELASRAGLPGLSRLAGRACSENPCLVFVPCHRVVAAANVGPPVIAGSYAGTGAVKKLLLEHEGVSVRDPASRDDASGF
ncbi:methylated-DNA--[protein]-cysteine S-methyltransferase [Flaviflexus huanghaiensis]|uniref:methylated-DNA--[protein]-cysteine S-methyltransferase n=1 Tax=Flaviflexus huanghaiensis TaxID=1111473 RepID=UPI0015FB6430|nr:methylated-DNA--[protein]-cysteine S-methyltransferase [Flaviflexus huanghaiensis]